MTQPDQQVQQPQAHPVADVALAVGAVELARGAADPFLPSRWRRLAGLLRAEREMFARYSQLLTHWIDQVRNRVVRGTVVDPPALFAVSGQFAQEAETVARVVISNIYESAWHDVMVDTPLPPSRVETYLASAVNRLVGVPDRVYSDITAEVLKAYNAGDHPIELARRVQDILTGEDLPTWKNRALVIARTEALSAYNAGTHAGFLAYAQQVGGEWEKGWLATHDHRTRPTHRAADIGTPATGQRVPLTEPFKVGTALLDFPGDPTGPPEEVIQCRCSQVLLRPGEHVDLSNRHGKGRP